MGILRIQPIAFLLLAPLVCGCWKRLDSQKSPDGQYEVVVRAAELFGESTVAIDLVKTSSTERIWTDPSDRGPLLVQIVWSTDSKLVGVIEFDKFAPDLVFAYDVKQRRKIDSALVTLDFRRALTKRYGLEQQVELDPSFDPIDWVNKQLIAGKIPTLD